MVWLNPFSNIPLISSCLVYPAIPIPISNKNTTIKAIVNWNLQTQQKCRWLYFYQKYVEYLKQKSPVCYYENHNGTLWTCYRFLNGKSIWLKTHLCVEANGIFSRTSMWKFSTKTHSLCLFSNSLHFEPSTSVAINTISQWNYMVMRLISRMH